MSSFLVEDMGVSWRYP